MGRTTVLIAAVLLAFGHVAFVHAQKSDWRSISRPDVPKAAARKSAKEVSAESTAYQIYIQGGSDGDVAAFLAKTKVKLDSETLKYLKAKALSNEYFEVVKVSETACGNWLEQRRCVVLTVVCKGLDIGWEAHQPNITWYDENGVPDETFLADKQALCNEAGYTTKLTFPAPPKGRIYRIGLPQRNG